MNSTLIFKCVFAATLVLNDQNRKKQAACKIQTYWRGYCARQELKKLRTELALRRNAASVTIQCAWRCYSARKMLG